MGVAECLNHQEGDIRDISELELCIKSSKPEVVFHMAAQPLVRRSYADPIETYSTNVMGTANLLDVVRRASSVRAVIVITSDKCYENREWPWGYREQDRLGGFDPCSNSKACAELVTAGFRDSYFPTGRFEQHKVAVASARAGNVIGGGDWATDPTDRLIPDLVRGFLSGRPVTIRNPHAIRPWQHVLEPLAGYITLASPYFGLAKHRACFFLSVLKHLAGARCACGWLVDDHVVSLTLSREVPVDNCRLEES